MKTKLILILSLILLTGCATPFGAGIFNQTTKEPTNSYNYERHVTVKPQYITNDSTGLPIGVANSIQIDESIGLKETKAKQNFWFWLFTQWWVWLIAGILFFVPGALNFVLWRAKANADTVAHTLSDAMKQTVTGVENFFKSNEDQAAKDLLLKNLSSTMTPESKIVVSNIKQGVDPVPVIK